MNRWEPSDILVLLIVILVMFFVVAAVGTAYFGAPFNEARGKALSAIFDSLITIVAMYFGSKLNSK